jgi:hypothetical protein
MGLTVHHTFSTLDLLGDAEAGGLNDTDDAGAVESPIWRHPLFERLEAEAARKDARSLKQSVEVVAEVAE